MTVAGAIMEVDGVAVVAAAAAAVLAAAASPYASGEEGSGVHRVHQEMSGFHSTGLVGVALVHWGRTWHKNLGSRHHNVGLCIW